MREHLDEVIRRLAAAPIDRDLTDLNAQIARGVRLYRRESQTTAALGSVRLASVGLALAMGVTLGSAAAIRALQPLATFSAAAHLAPSTLLEGVR